MNKVIYEVFINGKFERAVYATSADDAIKQVAKGADKTGYTAMLRYVGCDMPGA